MIDLKLLKENEPIELKLVENSTGGEKEEIYIGSGEMPKGYKVQIDPTGEATGIVKDVLVNGATIVENGVANIPRMSANGFGVAKIWNAFGINIHENGHLMIEKANTNDMNTRDANYKSIVPSNFGYMLKRAMSDGIDAEWTQEEKAMARLRLGDEWRYIGKIETQEDVISMSMSLDENGQPFRLRKVYLKAVNYPNQNDYETWIRFYFNNKSCNVFNDSSFFTGVKQGDTKKACEVVLEKIGNKLIPISIFKSINSTNAANIMSPYLTYGYRTDMTDMDGYINEITLSGYQLSIGAGAYFEVWGVDA